MPRSSVGEKLPLVTSPTGSPSTSTGCSARGGRRPSTARPRRRRATPRSRSAASGVAAPEVALVPRHHPAQPGLQRGDARAQLVAVQRQAGLEPQRVAGPEARRASTPAASTRVPHRGGGLGRHGQLDAVLARVAGAGHDARDAEPRRPSATRNRRGRPAASGATRGQPLAGVGALHGDDRPRRR